MVIILFVICIVNLHPRDIITSWYAHPKPDSGEVSCPRVFKWRKEALLIIDCTVYL